MRYLVNGSTRSMARFHRDFPDHLGHLIQPANWAIPAKVLFTGLPWAADNGAYSHLDEAKFRRMLFLIRDMPRCLFVVCPDKVGGGQETLTLFWRWKQEVASCGQPLAFVGQDGAEDTDVPWDDFHAWFLGGTDRFKLSRASADLVQEARRQGKYVHMGRVNSLRRIETAHEWGCDSVDGTSASMYGDAHIPRYCRFLAHLDNQRVLFS